MLRVQSDAVRPRLLLKLVLFWLCCVAGLAASPRSASAEELGTRQNLVFSAERLFGFYIDNETREANGRKYTTDRTVIGLGWSSPTSPLTLPRLGIDYFISSAFTLGGNVGFSSVTTDDNTATSFLIGLRAGYALRLGHSVSLWPRAGFTYTSTDFENTSADTYTFALSVDAPFTFALTEGFAFMIGPMLDVGFLAERGDQDASQIIFGLSIGLTGWTNL
jgi:hypothetical protein